MMGKPPYNYSTFPYEGMAQDFAAWTGTLPVAGPAPDFEAVQLDTRQCVRLSDFTRDTPVLVEFGSLT
jgi:hypothetical protein